MDIIVLEVSEMQTISIQYKQCNLQHRPPMLFTMGWNMVCILNNNLSVFSVGVLVYIVAHNIRHTQCS